MHPGAKIPFTEGELAELNAYIMRELDEALEMHYEREERLIDWQRAYDGDPVQKRKTFPWPGAANLNIPLVGIAVDSITARVVNTIFAPRPFWTVMPLRKEVDMLAKPIESYLDWSQKNEMALYAKVRANSLETVKFGWSWYKFGWENYSVARYMPSRGGGGLELREEIIRRPNIYHVLVMDMITQAGVEDEEQAEWIAHRFRLTDNQVRQRVRDNHYGADLLDKILEQKEDASRQHEMLQSARTEVPIPWEKMNTFYEFWMDWPYGPGKSKPLVPTTVTWHMPTKQAVRAVFNAYGFRPFKKTKFIEREGRLEGFGIAKRLWQFQEEISTIHNQRLDSATVANTKFFLAKKNTVRPGTQIWPGRVLPVNNPKEDFIAVSMGESLQTMRDLELSALAYSERASGVSDPQLGREAQTLGSRATATGTLALIQEGNRRFDLNVRDIRDVLSFVGQRTLELNQMFRPKGAAFFVQGADGRYTEQALDLPAEFSISKLAVELTASTATINREVEKQSLIALMGITGQYYERLTQAAMVLANPQIPGEIKELIVKESQGAKLLMDRIVQAFDVKSIDVIVPSLLGDKPNGNGPQAPGISPPNSNAIGDQANGRMENVPPLPGGANAASAAGA